jgi:hypothetical protein
LQGIFRRYLAPYSFLPWPFPALRYVVRVDRPIRITAARIKPTGVILFGLKAKSKTRPRCKADGLRV